MIRTVSTSTSNGKISPFPLEVNGMIGKKDLVLPTNFSRIMAEKHKETISHVHGWVNGQILLAVTRLYSLMIRGAHLPILLWDREPEWDSGLGLGLVQ